MPDDIKDRVATGAELADKAIEALKAGVAPAQPSPEPAVAPAPGQTAATPGGSPPPQTVEGSPAAPVQNFEEKYNVLQGKYNAEVPRLLTENAELKRRLSELETRPNGDNGTAHQAQPAQDQTAASAPQYTEADFEAYGPEFKQLYLDKQRLEQQVKELSDNYANDAQARLKAKRDEFHQVLGQAVPEWDQINHDPRFFSFLAEIDQMSGVRKHDLLRDASSKLDHTRVVAIFKEFIDSPYAQQSPGPETVPQNVNPQIPQNPAPAPAPAPAQVPSPYGQPVTPAPVYGQPVTPAPVYNPNAPTTVAQQVTPNAVTGAPAQMGKIWTPKEIDGFYEAKRRGDYRANPAQAVAIEQDIYAAQTQGRIAAY